MPGPTPITKFITAKGAEPRYTTEDYWDRYQYSMLATIKAKPDALIAKKQAAAAPNATTTLSEDNKLNLEVLKGSFLEALGEDAVYEIQQQHPKETTSPGSNRNGKLVINHPKIRPKASSNYGTAPELKIKPSSNTGSRWEKK